MDKEKEIILCCANCDHSDPRRHHDNKIRCKWWHKDVDLEYYCDDYDYGTVWVNAKEMLGDLYAVDMQ